MTKPTLIASALILTGGITAAMTIPSPMKDTTNQLNAATQTSDQPVSAAATTSTPTPQPTDTPPAATTVPDPTITATPDATKAPTPTPEAIGTTNSDGSTYVGAMDQPVTIVRPTPPPPR